MPTTRKKATISLTKDDVKILELIKTELNETTSSVFKRALIYYYHSYIKGKKDV